MYIKINLYGVMAERSAGMNKAQLEVATINMITQNQVARVIKQSSPSKIIT